jgi:3'-phosphoadenosine 5'-phosphosulfate sulfotransferase (PAPS reductase)/FAD synthetase
MLSYGKDSLACLGAIETLGLPLTRIVHAEVWATDSVQADLPPMVDFKAKADEIIKQRWGITVEHIWATKVDRICGSKVSFEDVFYHKLTKGKFIGAIKGFPPTCRRWCQKLKTNAANLIASVDDIQYLGIASDEPNRIQKHESRKNIILPLAQAGWTEKQCKEWCLQNDLLSPIYTDSERGGCWFCPCQGLEQLRLLRKRYPDRWELLLKWDNDSPVPFHSDGHTVHDYEKRFALEDEGLIDPNGTFRWSMLDAPLQYKMRWE